MKRFIGFSCLILVLILSVAALSSCDKKKGGAKDTASAMTGESSACVHEWSEFIIDSEPTCSVAGQKSRYCKKCDEQDPASITAIPQLPHTPGEEFVIDDVPTCTDGGYKSKHCTVCLQPIAETVTPLDPDPANHNVEVWSTEPTLLNPVVHRTGVCTRCHEEQGEDATFKHDVQIFTTASGKYTANYATLGEIRGGKHFYDAGNDLLVEYSILWNESLLNLYNTGNVMPAVDTRFVPNKSGSNGNMGIVRLELTNDCKSQWATCKFAGGLTAAGTIKPDHPYPRFGGTVADPTAYPNLGGANAGDGQPLGDTQWGWHRVQIRVREEVSNADAVKSGADATYYIQIWIYIDGVPVSHTSTTEISKDVQYDRQFFTAASDGAGGIEYTENDALYLHGAFLDSKRMKSDKGYFEIADYSATIGSAFVQDVKKATAPDLDAKLEVESGVFVPSTMWYEAK